MTHIKVASICPLLVDAFLQTASRFTEVKGFTVQGDVSLTSHTIPDDSGDRFSFDVPDILKLASCWPRLRTLCVDHYQNSQPLVDQDYRDCKFET